ncbi:hypothetical protein HDU67_003668, partial [Dinochytrium kinnereticum]
MPDPASTPASQTSKSLETHPAFKSYTPITSSNDKLINQPSSKAQAKKKRSKDSITATQSLHHQKNTLKKSRSKSLSVSKPSPEMQSPTASTRSPTPPPVASGSRKKPTVKSGMIIGRPRGRPRSRTASSVNAPQTLGFVNIVFGPVSEDGKAPWHREVLTEVFKKPLPPG